MKPAGVITLLTDFGLSEPFVGQLRGVILTRGPQLQIIDLTHGVPPHDVALGAFWLERSYRYFPAGSVHVAVVDPGVGSERRAIVARAEGHLFVAPDNGLLSGVLGDEAEVWCVDPGRLGIVTLSRTFHGRDLFAPVAAELALGRVMPDAVGGRHRAVRLDIQRAILRGEALLGAVIFADHFGNLVTNIDAAALARLGAKDTLEVELGSRRVPLRGTYSDVEPGELVAVVSSFDTVEIACREGRADQVTATSRGAPVRVTSRVGLR
ncbi:MAG: SAM-dependent chlorinase/fluorinase [Polyangiaceae bacterium]|nr:SAM-dependent chlorinase/fluorinase [Polyangiaceae bacterium]